MNYRIAEILAATDLESAGTKTIDINLKDIISRIEINFKATAVTPTIADHPAANLVKVELVDGSDVLYSLTGKEGQAIDYYDRRKPAETYISRTAGDSLRAVVGMNFGRHLFDPMLALDPTRFRNLQLKITHNEAVCDTSSTVNECRVHAQVFDKKAVSPLGFLMSKEHYAYTATASGYQYIDLPTDHILRALFIQAQVAGTDMGSLLSEFRLSEDNDKVIPFDTKWLDEFYRHKREYGSYIEHIQTIAPATAGTIYVTPAIAQTIVGSLDTPDLVFKGWSLDGGSISIEAETANHEARIVVIGFMPHGVVCFPFGNQADLDDWYDVTKLGSLRLRILAASGAGTTNTFRVLTQQLRHY